MKTCHICFLCISAHAFTATLPLEEWLRGKEYLLFPGGPGFHPQHPRDGSQFSVLHSSTAPYTHTHRYAHIRVNRKKFTCKLSQLIQVTHSTFQVAHQDASLLTRPLRRVVVVVHAFTANTGGQTGGSP